MEEKKTSNTTGANWLVLLILLVSAIIIALMWVMVFKLSEDKTELDKEIRSSKNRVQVLETEVLVLRKRVDMSDAEIEEEVEKELEAKNKEDNKETDKEKEDNKDSDKEKDDSKKTDEKEKEDEDDKKDDDSKEGSPV